MACLKNHMIMRSSEVDELRDVVANLTVPHYFDVKDDGAGFDAVVNSTSLERLSISFASYGQVHIDLNSPEVDSDDFLLCTPTSGIGIVNHEGKEWVVNEQTGSFRTYAKPLIADQLNISCIALSLSRDILASHARTLLGEGREVGSLAFDPEIDFTTPGGQVFRKTLTYVAEVVDDSCFGMGNPFILAQIEDLLLTQVLTVLPNSLSDAIEGLAQAKVMPYYVKRARDYIHEHADQKITLADLSEVAGCGYRTLQSAFNSTFGKSPMEYVRTVRLMHVREEITVADPSVSIGGIAARWGFSHMGRFSQAYRLQFGELPSETLKYRS